MESTLFISCLCLGIAAAIISVTMIVIMPLEPVINWWFRFGYKVGIKQPTIRGYQEEERWFYRPIWGCEKCFAGQIALWWYFLGHIEAQAGQRAVIEHGAVCWAALHNYSFICHLLAVCSAIMAAVLLSSFIKSKTNHEQD